ncbi:kis [Drosophila busckii]|uniref:Kis n=1 Tax=Drosophila busckii TaxID=30019 RepID=A0A0M5J8S9_DROBS|nr:kis [Drosophila busckii]
MDGNAQNMFHGNHQGDPYYRYDTAAAAAAAAAAANPRAMGPPGGYPPRHRAPHPLQQQPQYPSYQPTAENLYGLGAADQHAIMGVGAGMGDLSGWGAAPSVPGQAGAYPGAGLGAYGHPQAAPPTQQQRQSNASAYRQHMPAYGQQEQQNAAAVAAASNAASAAAAMLDSNSQSSNADFDKSNCESEQQQTTAPELCQDDSSVSKTHTETLSETTLPMQDEPEKPSIQTTDELLEQTQQALSELSAVQEEGKSIDEHSEEKTQAMLDAQQTNVMGMPPHPLSGYEAQQTPAVPPVAPPPPPHMPPAMMPPYGGAAPGMYPPYPMLHQQEIAALQQQIQELYCMPPGLEPQHQEKLMRLQERLNLLQQHEVTEQCAGGPQCLLFQSMPPMYGSSALHNQMIESPQVSSTTGRGRGKGANKPRKPRAKKGDKSAAAQQQQELMDISGNVVVAASTTNTQLPVSEDCVTQGAGDTSVVGMLEYSEGMGDLSQDLDELDTSTDGSGKKKKPRKPRTPKDPNKPPRDRTPKPKKQARDPNDPSTNVESPGTGGATASARKRGSSSKRRKQFGDDGAEQAGEGSELEDNKPLVAKSGDGESEISGVGVDGESPDYDDIPVSKIPRGANDEDKDADAGDETVDSVPDSAGDATSTPSRRDRKRSTARSRRNANSEEGGSSARRNRSSLSAKALKKRRNRGRIVPESDGEDDTLERTPPPSPPPDAELDSNKRRSSRNTQRKKYIDDVMLRFSDDENSLLVASPVKKEKKAAATTANSNAGSDVEKTEAQSGAEGEAGSERSAGDEKPSQSLDDTNSQLEASSSTSAAEKAAHSASEQAAAASAMSSKPNYVYINTGDEDSMVVQLVLAMRMGKRELIPDKPKEKTPEPSADKKEDEKENAEPSKEPTTEATEKTAEEAKPETETKTEDEPTLKEEAKAAEEQKMEVDEKPEDKEEEKEADEESTTTEEKAEENNMEVDEPAEKVSEEDTEKSEQSSSEEETKSEANTVEETSKSADTDKEEDDTETAEVKSVKPTGEEEEEKMEVDSETKEKDKEATTTEEDETKVKPEATAEKSDEDKENKTQSSEEKEDKKEDEETKDKDKPEPVYIEVEEYFVKYRNFSYLHCEWRTEEELLKGDRRVAAKVRRFQQKQAQQINIFENIEEEPFNPDFVEVDRVLDMSVHTDENTGETTKHYLVKWKSLPYEDCTWELEEDVDNDKIEQYLRFNKVPLRCEWKSRKRPHPEQWKKLEKTPIYKAGNSLRPYQLEGLNWLKFSWYNSHNCILADEMGLGKTIQSLTFVHSVYEYGIRGPFLVIAPLSTIPNWQREFEGWTDMNVVVYHGSVTSKQMIQDYEFYYKTESGKVLKEPIKFNVLITTFEMIVTDYMDLKAFNWRLCVIDEAHRLKNRNCKLLEGLRQLNLEHRVLLSGTPLQNNISELFSLLNFLEPSQFSSQEEFMSEFGSLRTEEEVNKLQVLLKPMMLRRLKDDVEKSLAPKEETIIEVELTNIQKKYYRGILEQNFSFLKKGTTSANIPNLMNTMMELRKCCIHPYLLNGAEEQIQYDFKAQHGEDPESYYKNLILSAGKMVLIDKLLPKLKANGHRVLIFSQMVRCLDILEDYLVYRKYPFERIDGRIRGNLRQEAIDRYSKPGSDRFVFLLCTKAGGLGINLTAADTVIIYDSDWNPQNDLQAQARCHRIGQRKMVKIYRLLCRNTYEREMFDKASMKLGLDKAVLQSMNTHGSKDGNNKQLTKKEIEDLLKKGAYGAVMDDDNAGDKFCEEDIDSILKRRTQIITMESEKGSTFSKASFAASGNRSDITIDDPDFWTKWAKRVDIDPDACERDETEDLVLSEPRRRTQIKRYGHEDVMEINSEDSSNENSDEEGGIGLRSRRRKEKRDRNRERKGNDEYIPRERDALAALGLEEIQYGNWAKSECFKVEKGLLSFG